MNRVIRTFRAETAHRLQNHEGKCKHLHGHSYVIHVEASGPLDTMGRVIDFGDLKDGIGKWIADHLDHGTVLEMTDPLVAPIQAAGSKLEEVSCPPTAEYLAQWIGAVAQDLHQGVTITSVKVWETEHGMAEWCLPYQEWQNGQAR